MRISIWVRAGAMLELGSPWGECGHALLRVGAEEGLQTTEVGGRRRGGWLPACDWHTQWPPACWQRRARAKPPTAAHLL